MYSKDALQRISPFVTIVSKTILKNYLKEGMYHGSRYNSADSVILS